jgi:hypothetical protein
MSSTPASPASDSITAARAAAAAAIAATPTVATTPARVPGRRGRPKGSVNGSTGSTGIRAATKRAASASPQAKSTAAVILEGLTGLRSAPEAARALGVTVARYYTVEAQAIAGLLGACEPAPPGPAPGMAIERELTRLRQEHRRQEQEVARLRAVLRTTQRTLGVAPPAPAPAARTKPGDGKEPSAKHRRARRPVVRALTIVRRLQAARDAAVGVGPAAVGASGQVSTTPAASSTSARGPGGG